MTRAVLVATALVCCGLLAWFTLRPTTTDEPAWSTCWSSPDVHPS